MEPSVTVRPPPTTRRSREQSRHPPSTRASSRTSNTSTTFSKMALQSQSQSQLPSANSSATNLTSSPSQRHALPLYKVQHNLSRRGSNSTTSDRPRSRLSRDTADDTRRHDMQTPTITSTYLQEKLRRERLVEGERSASRMGTNSSIGSPIEQRAAQSSPTRTACSGDSRRPGSSGDHAEADMTQKKGVGLKEMEQTLTNLHKQNFDLKLELFHRREKQNALEERAAALETEKTEIQDLNDKLLAELEKRDRAVEEAVAMIVQLEARNEQLVREREMVKHVEAEGLLFSKLTANNLAHKSNADIALRSEDARSVARMPSFLSERSDNTENLRQVYLGVRGSILSLERTVEEAHESNRRQSNGLSDMSVLSESSFVSIYGQKPIPKQDAWSPQDTPTTEQDVRPQPHTGTTTRPRRTSSVSRNAAGATFNSISELMEKGRSPLQQIEAMELPPSASRAVHAETITTPIAPSHQLSRDQAVKSKQGKRDSLRNVVTNSPISKQAGHANNMPPTPDTISTSTLRRMKNSNDTLAYERMIANEKSYLALSETSVNTDSLIGKRSDPHMPNGQATTQPPSMTAFSSRREDGLAPDNFFSGHQPIPPRPRSADDSTVSRRGLGYRDNGWDSDVTDDIYGDDSASVQDMHDYWMRESLRPTGTGHQLPDSIRKDRPEPDLFSFPSARGGWVGGAMFGQLDGKGFLGAGGAPLANTLDALGDSLPTPQAGYFGSGLASPGPNGPGAPPPPNRRSSLHARTGSTSAHAAITPTKPIASNGKLRKSPTRRSRSNSVDSQVINFGTQTPSVSQQQETLDQPSQRSSAAKQKYYPPMANPPRSRVLSFFRRSGSHEQQGPPPPPASAPPTESPYGKPPPSAPPAPPPKAAPAAMVGVPSWGRRGQDHLLDDDRESATPPPILRNPRLARRRSAEQHGMGPDGGASLAPQADEGAPLAVVEAQAPPSSAGQESDGPNTPTSGAKRRWFGVGRRASLRNRPV